MTARMAMVSAKFLTMGADASLFKNADMVTCSQELWMLQDFQLVLSALQ